MYSEGLVLTNNNSINVYGLERFLELLSEREQDLLNSLDKRNNPLLNESTESTPEGDIVNVERYKSLYYTNKLNCGLEEVDVVCFEFLDGMQWVLEYYNTSFPPSWDWYYPYHYAPLLSDLRKAVKGWGPKTWKPSKPMSAFEQLLCVLPP